MKALESQKGEEWDDINYEQIEEYGAELTLSVVCANVPLLCVA